jgi:hypothetical protein
MTKKKFYDIGPRTTVGFYTPHNIKGWMAPIVPHPHHESEFIMLKEFVKTNTGYQSWESFFLSLVAVEMSSGLLCC